jgi:hypothetical protein
MIVELSANTLDFNKILLDIKTIQSHKLYMYSY